MKLKALLFCALTLALLTFPDSVSAVSCSGVPISGNYTVSASCEFANTADGVDSGTGTSNSAIITVNNGVTLTVASGQTIAWGGMTLNGTIVITRTPSSGAMKKSPIWMTDADSDNYPSSTTQIIQTTQPADGIRRNLMNTVSSTDCNSTSVNVYQNVAGTATDADQDGYSTGTGSTNCVGSSTVITRTYYKNTSGLYTWVNVDIGPMLGSSDCSDSDATLAPSRTWYTDADGDGYTLTGGAGECETISTWATSACNTAGSAYAKNSATTCRRITSLGTDCSDASANVYQTTPTTAADTDRDRYIAGSTYSGNCIGSSDGTWYRDTGGTYTWLPSANALGTNDCDTNNASVTGPVTQYVDADGDGWDDGGTTTSQGANNATTAVNDPIIQGGGATNMLYGAWGVPSSALTDGSGVSPSTSLLEGSSRAHFLKLTNYGFTIPSTALITGIEVGVKRYAEDIANNQVRDTTFKIVKNGIISGSEQALSTTNWKKWSLDAPTGYETKTYGSSTNAWGLLWTPAEINATNFGVALAVQSATTATTIGGNVDHIWIKVYYKPTATPVSQCPTAGYSTGTSGVDCDNASATNWRILYPDVDADTYRSIAGGTCVGNQAGYGESPTDCNDGNANVKPGQTSYFTASGGMTGLWDYNCDGVLTGDPATPNYCPAASSVSDNFYDLSNCTNPIAGTTRILSNVTAVSGNEGSRSCGQAACETKYYCSGPYACECGPASHGSGVNVGCR